MGLGKKEVQDIGTINKSKTYSFICTIYTKFLNTKKLVFQQA